MKFKKLILNLENEIDLKTWSSLNKSHNSVKRQTNWPT